MVVFVVPVRTVFHEVVLNGDDLFRLAGTQDSLQCGQCYWPRKAARAKSVAQRAVCFPLCIEQGSLAAGLGEA